MPASARSFGSRGLPVPATVSATVPALSEEHLHPRHTECRPYPHVPGFETKGDPAARIGT